MAKDFYRKRATLIVSAKMYMSEGSPSGLWRRLGKAVWEQSHRGFESLSLRHYRLKLIHETDLFNDLSSDEEKYFKDVILASIN